MTIGADHFIVAFQCPKCGHDLEQSIGRLKAQEHMRCPSCGVGINIDADRFSDAIVEMRRALQKAPPEITIKFFNR